jgi:biopolymer transport protein ExbB/TolQ
LSWHGNDDKKVSLGMVLLNITEWTVVYAHSLFTAIFGVYASYQQRRLTDLGSVRKLQNELRRETNGLMEENVNLHLHVNELNDSVYQVQQVELDLQRISRTSQGNIRRLVHISRAQQDIHEKMKVSTILKTMQYPI